MLTSVERRFPVLWLWLLRAGMVVGVLAFGVAVGWIAVRMARPWLLLPFVFLPLVGALGLGRARIEHGIVGVIAAAAVIRYTLPTGTRSRIPISLVLAGGVVAWWVASQWLADRKVRLKPSPVNVPLLGFVAVSIISLPWSIAFRDVLVQPWPTWPFVQLGGLAVMVLLPGVFLVAAQQEDTRWVRVLVGLLLVVGTAAILRYYLRLPYLDFLQVRPLFPTWFICLALALGFFHRRLPLLLRLALVVLAGAWFYQVFVHQFRWLSSWVPAMAGLAAIGVLRSRKVLILLIVAVTLYVAFNLPAVEAKLQQEMVASGVTRVDAWLHNWRVTGEHWLFGVGPAGYAVYYMNYFPLEAMASHSTYIDVLSQTGVVGLFFFLWFWAATGVVLWRLYRRVKGRQDFAEAFGLAAVGGYVGALVAMALGDWIVPFVYTQTIAGFDYAVYTWALLGAAQALFLREQGSRREGSGEAGKQGSKEARKRGSREVGDESGCLGRRG